MRTLQKGNAVVFILLAVALFGGLAYTFMRGAKSGQGNLTDGQTKLAAQEILNYASAVEAGVNKLRQRGCSENELNFANAVEPTHTNPSAPVSKECDLFDPAGANISFLGTDKKWFSHKGEDVFWYTGSESFTGIGTTCANASCGDLAINLFDITKQLCDELNKLAGNSFTAIPTQTPETCWGQFRGKFECGSGSPPKIIFTDANLQGKRTVCYKDASYGYVFNHILLER